ncbi:MAG: hypothetical protein AB7T49_11495 [Oligoflexales bacterium]
MKIIKKGIAVFRMFLPKMFCNEPIILVFSNCQEVLFWMTETMRQYEKKTTDSFEIWKRYA